MFSLIKIVYLIRVFRQLNFLVTMLITVVNEVMFFILLFSIFVLTFAQCNHIVGVDISSYGRVPELLANFLAVLRCSMGDFSLIDPKYSFDIIDKRIDASGKIVETYKHSRVIMLFTFFIWAITIFFLFMIFMNFIIAVIGETYQKVV